MAGVVGVLWSAVELEGNATEVIQRNCNLRQLSCMCVPNGATPRTANVFLGFSAQFSVNMSS